MGAIVLLLTVGEDFEWTYINLFTVTCWLNWRQLVLIFFFSSSLFYFLCLSMWRTKRVSKYFSLNQAERKGGFQGQLQCKMPFITFIILSISSALRREGFSMTPIMIQSLTQDFSIRASICSHSEVPDLPSAVLVMWASDLWETILNFMNSFIPHFSYYSQWLLFVLCCVSKTLCR